MRKDKKNKNITDELALNSIATKLMVRKNLTTTR